MLRVLPVAFFMTNYFLSGTQLSFFESYLLKVLQILSVLVEVWSNQVVHFH